jgi:hypothetical protein
MTLVDYALLAELAYFDTDDTQVPLQQVGTTDTTRNICIICIHFYCNEQSCLCVLPVRVAHRLVHNVAA